MRRLLQLEHTTRPHLRQWCRLWTNENCRSHPGIEHRCTSASGCHPNRETCESSSMEQMEELRDLWSDDESKEPYDVPDPSSSTDDISDGAPAGSFCGRSSQDTLRWRRPFHMLEDRGTNAAPAAPAVARGWTPDSGLPVRSPSSERRGMAAEGSPPPDDDAASACLACMAILSRDSERSLRAPPNPWRCMIGGSRENLTKTTMKTGLGQDFASPTPCSRGSMSPAVERAMAAMTDACPAVRRQGLECLNSLARSHLRELVVNAIPCCPFRVLLDGFGAAGSDSRGSYDTILG